MPACLRHARVGLPDAFARLHHPLRHPATTVPGAILVTGLLGGAICADVRIGEWDSPPEEVVPLFAAAEVGFDKQQKAAFLAGGFVFRTTEGGFKRVIKTPARNRG